MLRKIRQYLCHHEFSLPGDLRRLSETEVTATCERCGKLCSASCGLDLPGIWIQRKEGGERG